MTRIHDLGGVQGFGWINREDNEPVFHAPWEGRVLAMYLLAKRPEGWNIDMGRHALERLEPVRYLSSSYYQRWLESLVLRMRESGLIEESEIEARLGAPDPAEGRAADPDIVQAMVARMSERHPYERPAPSELPSPFEAGARVRARLADPSGHTRLPAYVRGRMGEVVMRHGVHVFPDANAAGLGEQPTHLYAVRFEAEELFGAEADPATAVICDLWHPYLEPAE